MLSSFWPEAKEERLTNNESHLVMIKAVETSSDNQLEATNAHLKSDNTYKSGLDNPALH